MFKQFICPLLIGKRAIKVRKKGQSKKQQQKLRPREYELNDGRFVDHPAEWFVVSLPQHNSQANAIETHTTHIFCC